MNMFRKFDRKRAEEIGCPGCVFFEPDDSKKTPENATLGIVYGECRRRAPSSQPADVKALADIILHLIEKQSLEQLSDSTRKSLLGEFETYRGIYSFPYARSYNWCGEFQER
jgi:hypothetical protein